ncbi:MAG: DUF559 domain-containing protein [Microbacterium sp.]
MGHSELPAGLDETFSTELARRHGVSRSRLRSRDLRAPFPGVRISADVSFTVDAEDPYGRQRQQRVIRAREYAPRLHTGHFFSHQTAASIWGGPLPLELSGAGEPTDDPALHVCAYGPVAQPRTAGVVGHRTRSVMTSMREHDGLRVSSPAATWASLGGDLSLWDLVALGDYFCRVWRPGHGRRDVGRPALATRDELRDTVEAGRRRGAAKLRESLDLIREDSWSPRETAVRLILLRSGLPEPQLNLDVHDDDGRFLGCVDLAYPEHKVAIEYHGMLHGRTWAADVERTAALRAAGWTVIEVTSPLLRRPDELARRVAAALRTRR